MCIQCYCRINLRATCYTSQTLMAHKFKHFDRFQTVGCGYSMTFCIQRKGFVQILYDEVRHHWLAVAFASNGIDEPVVNVYDSLFHTASSQYKKQTACIVNTAYLPNGTSWMSHARMVLMTVPVCSCICHYYLLWEDARKIHF